MPDSWLSEKGFVLWPPVVNAEKAIKCQRKPAKTWQSYKLIKVKFHSGMFIHVNKQTLIHVLIQQIVPQELCD